jgi:N-hydroxyarylamine O-acetyltransferase
LLLPEHRFQHRAVTPRALADLPAYFRRIGLAAAPPATAEGLAALHRAHAVSIPFENLDILLGRPIRLDVPSLEAKLVAARRGGYCFEQNSLFAAALADLGFGVTPLAARVRLGGRTDSARAHMLLAVRAADRDWLCDVGFGGGGLLEPLPLEPSREVAQGLWRFRVVDDGRERVLQNMGPSGWRDLYAFTLEPQLPIDYVVANHYTSTSPESTFTKIPVVQRTSETGALALRGVAFQTVFPGEAPEETPAPSGDALLALLRERFGLDFPAGTRFVSRT